MKQNFVNKLKNFFIEQTNKREYSKMSQGVNGSFGSQLFHFFEEEEENEK